ncbi:hypothetical protein BURKHO8Y_110137 [Burkholderia sp. 8Y]|nr:hypothetical protein BURKHO8Y_110137 [Burkholderia sp. 8Y]
MPSRSRQALPARLSETRLQHRTSEIAGHHGVDRSLVRSTQNGRLRLASVEPTSHSRASAGAS